MARILIVEDSLTQAKQMTYVLEEAGFAVEAVPDAETGFACLEKNNFDLVLTDLLLPGDSGFDLCRKIKASPKHRQVLAIVFTSQDDPVNFLRGLQAGADGFMTKDREPEEIVARIRWLLSRTRIRSWLARETRSPNAMPAEPTRVVFLGQEFELACSSEQLLKVLVSAFEDVVHLNKRLKEEIIQRQRAEQALQDSRASSPSEDLGHSRL